MNLVKKMAVKNLNDDIAAAEMLLHAATIKLNQAIVNAELLGRKVLQKELAEVSSKAFQSESLLKALLFG